MNTFLWLGFSVLWTATGVLGVAWFARRRGNLLSSLRVGLPAFTAATMLIVVTASSSRSPLLRILHGVGVAILGLFLLATEVLRVLLRCQPEQAGDLKLRSLVRRCFQTATVLFAPPASILILFSGWRLMYDFKWSLQAPWLWWIYVLFAAMMWHGALFWTAEADRLVTTAESGQGARLPRGADLLMTVHGVLFLVILAIAFDRGATPLPNPGKGMIAGLESFMRFLPPNARSVGAAVCVWLLIGFLTGIAFRFARRAK